MVFEELLGYDNYSEGIGPLAQSAEHLPFKQRVAGSSPARLTFRINYLGRLLAAIFFPEGALINWLINKSRLLGRSFSGIVRLSRRVAQWSDEESSIQLHQASLSTRDHQSCGLALLSIQSQLSGS